MRTLVLYVFHKYNNLVDFFIKNAIFKKVDLDFLVICNNEYFDIKEKLPNYVTYLNRPNKGYDFAGWSHGLFYNDIYKNYDHFIFANSSVLGPYLPPGFEGYWTDIYVNELQENTKLFGSTINTLCDPINRSHVQSYIFAMDRTTLEYLIECEIFSISNYAVTYDDAVWKKEVLMSRKIIEKGWNIGSFLPLYKNVDFTFSDKKPEDYGIDFLDDIMFPKHLNNIFKPEEIIFIKGNRCPDVPMPKRI